MYTNYCVCTYTYMRVIEGFFKECEGVVTEIIDYVQGYLYLALITCFSQQMNPSSRNYVLLFKQTQTICRFHCNVYCRRTQWLYLLILWFVLSCIWWP